MPRPTTWTEGPWTLDGVRRAALSLLAETYAAGAAALAGRG